MIWHMKQVRVDSKVHCMHACNVLLNLLDQVTGGLAGLTKGGQIVKVKLQ